MTDKILFLPVIHIDQLAKHLGVERRWIKDNWVDRDEPEDRTGPAPCFRDGKAIFFNLTELDEWTKRRSFGSDSTDIEDDLSD